MRRTIAVATIAAISLLFASAGKAETFRLIQAIGNTEHESARGLSKDECEARKTELKAVATALGTYDEKTGFGSITCLADSLFDG